MDCGSDFFVFSVCGLCDGDFNNTLAISTTLWRFQQHFGDFKNIWSNWVAVTAISTTLWRFQEYLEQLGIFQTFKPSLTIWLCGASTGRHGETRGSFAPCGASTGRHGASLLLIRGKCGATRGDTGASAWRHGATRGDL